MADAPEYTGQVGTVQSSVDLDVAGDDILDIVEFAFEPNRAPWVWVSAADLIKATRTFDTVEN